MIHPRIRRSFVLLAAFLIFAACSPLISAYNAQAYKNATDIKASALSLFNLAGDPYSKHAKRVEGVLLEIDKAYEFSAGFEKNNISAMQWDSIRRTDKNFVGGFVSFWKASGGGVSKAFREQAKKGTAKAFDYIICLEANKKSTIKCSE